MHSKILNIDTIIIGMNIDTSCTFLLYSVCPNVLITLSTCAEYVFWVKDILVIFNVAS